MESKLLNEISNFEEKYYQDHTGEIYGNLSWSTLWKYNLMMIMTMSYLDRGYFYRSGCRFATSLGALILLA